MAERLTMQEVIEHCDETKELMERVFTCVHDGGEFGQIESKRYLEHKQTAEWLRELQKYKDLEEQGRLITLPCKIGDTVYGIRRYQDRIVKAGTVSEMFCNRDGELIIAIKNVCRGCWGRQIFGTREEAEAALKGAENANR